MCGCGCAYRCRPTIGSKNLRACLNLLGKTPASAPVIRFPNVVVKSRSAVAAESSSPQEAEKWNNVKVRIAFGTEVAASSDGISSNASCHARQAKLAPAAAEESAILGGGEWAPFSCSIDRKDGEDVTITAILTVALPVSRPLVIARAHCLSIAVRALSLFLSRSLSLFLPPFLYVYIHTTSCSAGPHKRVESAVPFSVPVTAVSETSAAGVQSVAVLTTRHGVKPAARTKNLQIQDTGGPRKEESKEGGHGAQNESNKDTEKMFLDELFRRFSSTGEGGKAGGEKGTQDGNALRMRLSVHQCTVIQSWTTVELSEWLLSVDMPAASTRVTGIIVHIVVVCRLSPTCLLVVLIRFSSKLERLRV